MVEEEEEEEEELYLDMAEGQTRGQSQGPHTPGDAKKLVNSKILLSCKQQRSGTVRKQANRGAHLLQALSPKSIVLSWAIYFQTQAWRARAKLLPKNSTS